MIARYRMNAGATEIYDTEMFQMDISGGNLPAGVMIRESPTLASAGGLALTPVSGVYQIQSFFDVFTEVSVDGGATWSQPLRRHVCCLIVRRKKISSQLQTRHR